MYLDRRIKIQLIVLTVITLIAGSIMVFGYMKLPATVFGVGRYTVILQLPSTGGLYPSSNVTYRGTEVGRVQDVQITDDGVEARLDLNSGIAIPSDLDAQVHSQSAIGEQYVALLPRDADAPPLKNGDVIPVRRATVPPDINELVDAANTGLLAIPGDNLQTVVEESYTALGGLGPDLSRLVDGSTKLVADAHDNLDAMTALIDNAAPVLDSQTQSADAVAAWASHIATVTDELRTQDKSVAGLLVKGPGAADEARALFERVQPTLGIVLANLVSVGNVAVTYRSDLEQLLVLVPQGMANNEAGEVPNLNNNTPYKGAYQDFALNLNLPPPCSTGYLPAQQRRAPALVDHPQRPSGDLYCRVPQDSPYGVRGVRNIPCETKAWKRAPTAKMCESDEEYVPLNDGTAWKGDPNATLSGQDVPQIRGSDPAAPAAPEGALAPPPTVATSQYDPATGVYIGPNGKVYTQHDLAQRKQNQSWQSVVTFGVG